MAPGGLEGAIFHLHPLPASWETVATLYHPLPLFHHLSCSAYPGLSSAADVHPLHAFFSSQQQWLWHQRRNSVQKYHLGHQMAKGEGRSDVKFFFVDVMCYMYVLVLLSCLCMDSQLQQVVAESALLCPWTLAG